uniref:Uncharacterized protein n=1 Tax=Arundo donax TaxID=35708 RepID=A0A0A9A8V1_ARUDO
MSMYVSLRYCFIVCIVKLASGITVARAPVSWQYVSTFYRFVSCCSSCVRGISSKIIEQ